MEKYNFKNSLLGKIIYWDLRQIKYYFNGFVPGSLGELMYGKYKNYDINKSLRLFIITLENRNTFECSEIRNDSLGINQNNVDDFKENINDKILKYLKQSMDKEIIDVDIYAPNYAKGVLLRIPKNYLGELPTKNCFIDFSNIIEIDKKFLYEFVNNPDSFAIVSNKLKNDDYLKLLIKFYDVVTTKQNNFTYQKLIIENLNKKPEKIWVDNKNLYKLNLGEIKFLTNKGIDNIFDRYSKNQDYLSFLYDKGFYQKILEQKENEISENYISLKNKIEKHTINTIINEIQEKKRIDKINDSIIVEKWIKEKYACSEKKTKILNDIYSNQLNQNHPKLRDIIKTNEFKKNIVDQFGNDINSTKENNTSKNVENPNKNKEWEK